ncbi:hypothetical protein TNCV_3509511 [Trichonephila clavipes]|nr:hypothetical protein TNCV_3509511 [Trichonephila clavipes]
MCGICLTDELQNVNSLPPVYRNVGGHCLKIGVIFPKACNTAGIHLEIDSYKCSLMFRGILYHSSWNYAESSESDSGGGYRLRIVRSKIVPNGSITLRSGNCAGLYPCTNFILVLIKPDRKSPVAWIGALSFWKIPSPEETKFAS